MDIQEQEIELNISDILSIHLELSGIRLCLLKEFFCSVLRLRVFSTNIPLLEISSFPHIGSTLQVQASITTVFSVIIQCS